MKDKKPFSERLVDSIKKSGLWVYEHAEEIANKPEGRTYLTITVSFDFNDNMQPEIKVDQGFTSLEAVKALYQIE